MLLLLQSQLKGGTDDTHLTPPQEPPSPNHSIRRREGTEPVTACVHRFVNNFLYACCWIIYTHIPYKWINKLLKMLNSVAQNYDASSGEAKARSEFKTLLGYEQVWGQSHMRPCLDKPKQIKKKSSCLHQFRVKKAFQVLANITAMTPCSTVAWWPVTSFHTKISSTLLTDDVLPRNILRTQLRLGELLRNSHSSTNSRADAELI